MEHVNELVIKLVKKHCKGPKCNSIEMQGKVREWTISLLFLIDL